MFQVLFAVLCAGAPPETHPFSVHDMLAMERVSDPQVSPDGKQILFAVRATDLDKNKGRTNLWLAAVDGSSVEQVTREDAGASDGRWMPDGRSFVYLSSKAGSRQVWRHDLRTRAAMRLTDLPVDVGGALPFPDGERLLLVLEVYPDLAPGVAPDSNGGALAATAARDKARADDPVQARIYESLLFRHWDTWEDGKRSHVFAWRPGEAPVDLMPGWKSDAPTHPFGGLEEIAISPDGTEVVFTAKEALPDAAWSTDVDVWSVPSDGSSTPRCLSEANQAFDGVPAFSPDGSKLAWLAMARPRYEADRQRIVLLDRASGVQRVLTEAWDRSAADLAWSADGRTIYASAEDVGQRALFAVDASTGQATLLVAQGYNQTPQVAGARVVFLQDTLAEPAELHSVGADGSGPRAITSLNAERVKAARTGDFEQFSFAGWNGETVHGYVVKPFDFAAGKKYPVAFLIHGGPQGSFGNHFHYRWNPQAYAGAGYAAVMIDFHGSTGYGQAFTDAIRGDWGGKPYEDLMKGLDAALARYPFLDGERVAALGASFGGYMINWIAGQTDRFRCLVSHDGNLDERMAYFDTEELWFPEWDHGGTPWDNPEGYLEHNPIDRVGSWKTPMLVIHGALDYRVVDTQGLSTFTALQRRGIPSKLLYFPDENHWVLKPRNSILWHETVLGWLDRWTGKEPSHGEAASGQ